MMFEKSIHVVGSHCGGERCDVITGGVPHVPGSTMYEKLQYLETERDDLRQLLVQEPRGTVNQCMNLITAPCDPRADIGMIVMECDEYAPMSGGNAISVVTVALSTGMIPKRPNADGVCRVVLDTAAGLVETDAVISDNRVESVKFYNVPAFVFGLDLPVDVPGIGSIKVDIAWGGMIYCLVDAASLGLEISAANGAELVRVGELIKHAVRRQHHPVHPLNSAFRDVTILELMGAIEVVDGKKRAINAVTVSPGRLDRCACGTGTSARLAVMHARGQLAVGEKFYHRSPVGCEFEAVVESTTKVGDYDAVVPSIKGRAYLSGFYQYVVEKDDPHPTGFRCGDLWGEPLEHSAIGR